MAANYIVVNSKFRPFSYAEMLQPIQMATEAHQAIENEYAELATKASVWEGMADAQKDPYAYSMYKNYANALEEQATQLAREGLTPGSRKDILNMRKRYSSDIIPIEQAYQRRKELIDEQRKLLAQDNTLMFDRNAATLSLDDLIRNPELSYQSYAGSTLMNQVGSAAKNLVRQMREDPRRWSQILGGQYFETKMQQGYTPEEILLAAANDEKAPKELRNLVEDAITSSGIRSWNDENILRRAYDYARQGLWNAVGETKYQTLQNRNWDLEQKKKDEEDLSRKRWFRPVKNVTVNPEYNTIQLQADIDLLRKIKEDSTILQKKAKRTVRASQYSSPENMGNFVIAESLFGLKDAREEEYQPYVEELNRMLQRYKDTSLNIGFNIDKESGNLTWQEGTNIDQLINDFDDRIKKSAVASLTYLYDITDSQLMNSALYENARGLGFQDGKTTGVYEFDNGKKKDQIAPNDLDSYFNERTTFGYSPEQKSMVLFTTDDNGEQKSALLDPAVFGAGLDRVINDIIGAVDEYVKRGWIDDANLLINGGINAEGYYQPGLGEIVMAFYNNINKKQSLTGKD